MKSTERGYDQILVISLVALIVIGWLVKVAAASTTTIFSEVDFFDFSVPLGKQTFWTIAALLLAIVTSYIGARFWNNMAIPIYGVGILLLVAVLLIGSELKGAKSWINIGGFSLQPSELAKFCTALALANFCANPSLRLTELRSLAISVGIFILPALLILLQPDAGSAIVFFSLLIVLYRKGMASWPIVVALIVAAIFIGTIWQSFSFAVALIILSVLLIIFLRMDNVQYWVLAWIALLVANILLFQQDLDWMIIAGDALLLVLFLGIQVQRGELKFVTFVIPVMFLAIGLSYATNFVFNDVLKPHQQDRINVWLHPEKCDPRGNLYNVTVSKMAISSGGFAGKGYLNGTLTKLNYVPEHTSDFIFCILAEEHGSIGSLVVLGLFFVLIFRIIYRSENQHLPFVKYYGYAVAAILFFHVLINIGMTVGLMPVIGIPLPFVSYGGSALLAFTLMISVFIQLDRQLN